MKKSLVLVLGLVLLSMTAFAGEQDFTLVNSTGVDIKELYISPTSVDNWQEDVLGTDILKDGESVTIKFSSDEDADFWDLKVIDSDGTSITWEKLKLTEISKVTLHYEDDTPTADCE